MAVKEICVLCVVLTACILQDAVCFPRDVEVKNANDITPVNEASLIVLPKVESEGKDATQETQSNHGRINCQFEEAAEDPVCEEHCLPKGYSYGLCVGNICSCV